MSAIDHMLSLIEHGDAEGLTSALAPHVFEFDDEIEHPSLSQILVACGQWGRKECLIAIHEHIQAYQQQLRLEAWWDVLSSTDGGGDVAQYAATHLIDSPIAWTGWAAEFLDFQQAQTFIQVVPMTEERIQDGLVGAVRGNKMEVVDMFWAMANDHTKALALIQCGISGREMVLDHLYTPELGELAMTMIGGEIVQDYFGKESLDLGCLERRVMSDRQRYELMGEVGNKSGAHPEPPTRIAKM